MSSSSRMYCRGHSAKDILTLVIGTTCHDLIGFTWNQKHKIFMFFPQNISKGNWITKNVEKRKKKIIYNNNVIKPKGKSCKIENQSYCKTLR